MFFRPESKDINVFVIQYRHNLRNYQIKVQLCLFLIFRPLSKIFSRSLAHELIERNNKILFRVWPFPLKLSLLTCFLSNLRVQFISHKNFAFIWDTLVKSSHNFCKAFLHRAVLILEPLILLSLLQSCCCRSNLSLQVIYLLHCEWFAIFVFLWVNLRLDFCNFLSGFFKQLLIVLAFSSARWFNSLASLL